jgi:capsular polysaccharide transport system ATP-binding protein
MIRVENLTKSYPLIGLRRHYVFRNLNLTFPERVNIGIVGRNGAGKSTLLRLLGGIEFPERGRIVVDGTVSPPHGAMAGFSHQLSGYDNAVFVCRINGLEGPEIGERVDFIRRFTDIGDFFDYPINTYSSGMRGRLAFSISMAFDFDYYLIDEITAAGDQKFKERAQAAFREKRGRSSVVMVSHALPELRRDCDVGLYIKRGEVQMYDSIDAAIQAYQSDMQ